MRSRISCRRQKPRRKTGLRIGHCWFEVRCRRLAFEVLEDRALLSIAQDLVNQLAPYQASLDSALNSATSLPLVDTQLANLSEFDSIFANSLSSIAAQTADITTNGHYQRNIALASLSKTFTFDLGLDEFLEATTAGGVNAAINPVLHVGFDYLNGAATLTALETNLDIDFNLSLPNFQATMSFNDLLFTKAMDAGTNFDGNLKFDFIAGGGLIPHFTGAADVNLDLSLSFVDPALDASFNPTFRTTLDLDWGFGADNQLTAPSIQLVDFGLDADSFLQGFFGDVVKTVQKFTKPIQPFVDVFQTPVPILSAFDSSETIGTLLLKGAGSSQAQQDSFKLMVQIINAVNAIDLSSGTGGAVIPFGTITVTGNPQQQGAFGFNTDSVTNAIDDILGVPALQTVEDTLKKVGNYSGTTSTAGFQFPLLENPSSVIAGILLGNPDTTLFSFTTGRQHFELAPSLGVGIPGVFGIFLSAGIVFDANLTMGYDTAGILAYAQDPGNVSKLLHGFYFDNSIDTSIPPKPNTPLIRKTGLYLQGLMELKADVLIAHASGGLYANINVELANTDASNHVHMDTMISNLNSGGKVFKLGGKLYASADLSLELSLPIGPDIEIFSFNLGYAELLNFDPPPPPTGGPPITVIDVTDQHTLTLDVNKMGVGSVVTVQPFHDTSVTVGGNTFEADGIRVDYPGEIYLFVERKNNTNSNYYNFIALSGAAPDGVSINVIDPFRVFKDEGALNPIPAQTKPGVLLVGGKNVIYTYNELPDGSQANALLVGGYGSNTLTGGTTTFGNFIPADRIAQAKAHFADTSGFDGVGQGLINSQIDAVIAPADPAGIIGATMTASRGGLMMGGPGNNSFIATGAGVYEMIGGSWINTFNISPSFSGGPATYQIDGGNFGQSSLIVRVPFDETVLFENAAVPDKHHPEYKALSVGGRHGPSAIAHGIQKVKVIASPGSTVEFGDTSEVNAAFSIVGGARLKFSGTGESDVFDVTATGFFFAKKNHFTVGDLFAIGPNPSVLLPENPLVPGVGSTTLPDPIPNPIPPPDFYIPDIYLLTRWADPVYSVTRTFGTNGRIQTTTFGVSDADASSIILDGKGRSDSYNIEQGVGGFLDITIEDSDSSTRNTATVELIERDLVYSKATLTDNSLTLGFFTYPTRQTNIATELPIQYPQFYKLGEHKGWTNSVYYSPTVFFGANVDFNFDSAGRFQEFVVDRPTAPQSVNVRFGVMSRHVVRSVPGGSASFDVSFEPTLPLWVYDPEGPSSEIVYLGPAPVTTTLRSLYQQPVLNILNNAGDLSINLQLLRDHGISVTQIANLQTGVTANIQSNSGNLTFHDLQVFSTGPSTFNIAENSGTINFEWPELPSTGPVINVLANAGTIDVHGDGFHKTQVNLGDHGSLANVHGTVRLAGLVGSSGIGFFSVVLDDRNNSAAGRHWTIDSGQAKVGDLTLIFPAIFAGGLEVRPNAGSTVDFDSVPPFNRPNEVIDVIGTGSDNTLVGPLLDGGQTWRINGPDSGTMPISGLFGMQQFRWQNMQTLVGSDGDDTFQFIGGSVSGDLDGGGGFNTLFYDPPPTPFIVDIANGIAPLVGGIASNIQAVIPDTPPPPPGDYDGNGIVDDRDYDVWKANFGASVTPGTSGDGNGDGVVDAADYVVWRAHFGSGQTSSLPGDYDRNGTVATADYSVWRASFGQTVTPSTAADGNGDGIVDAADYVVWRAHLGMTSPGTGAALAALADSALSGAEQDTSGSPKDVLAPQSRTPYQSRVIGAEQTRLLPISNGTHARSSVRNSATSPRLTATKASAEAGLLAWLSTPPAAHPFADLDAAWRAGGDATNSQQDTGFDGVDLAFELLDVDISASSSRRWS